MLPAYNTRFNTSALLKLAFQEPGTGTVTQRAKNKARKSKYSRTSIKRPTFFLAASGQNPGKKLSASHCNKIPYSTATSSGRRQLLAVPRMILFFIYTSSCLVPQSGLFFKDLTVIYRKLADFVIMSHLSKNLNLFTRIMISATHSFERTHQSFITTNYLPNTYSIWQKISLCFTDTGCKQLQGRVPCSFWLFNTLYRKRI